MYIKIGDTSINYKSDVDDYMIFSEVPDSQLSYEKPILVRTKDELDIWFGKDFTDRNYFDELLKKRVTLYLYKPIKENNTRDIDDYIDIETYYIFPEIFLELPEIGEPGYTYYLKTVSLYGHYYKFGFNNANNEYEWMPADTIEGCIIESERYNSIYDLPNIGQTNHVYYVSIIPEERHWYKFENEEWVHDLEYKEHIQYRRLFPHQDSLPNSGIFKYYVIQDNAWYIWENNEWSELINLEIDDNNYNYESTIQEFPIQFDTFEDLPIIGDNYKYYVNGSWYIWLADSWTSENIFPQNLDNISESLNNRDTLIISKPGQYTEYSHPEFRLYEDYHLGVFSQDYDDLDFSEDKIYINSDLEKINLGYKTLAIKLSYNSYTLDEGYIMIYNFSVGGNYLYYTGSEFNISPQYYKNETPIQILNIDDLVNAYINCGYKVKNLEGGEYLVYSDKLFEFNEFYTYKNITINNSFDDTENILTKSIDKHKGFEFYSKTIGSSYESSENNEESLISVKIENTDYEKYRVTIGRYDYTEIFEGPLFSDIGENRLDHLINNNSKLVMCNLIDLKNYIKSTIYTDIVSDSYLVNLNDFSFKFKDGVVESGNEYSVRVEKIDYEYYAIYILAGDLSEAYNGNLFDIADTINDLSEIVENFKFKGLCNSLREGTYYLRRGKSEEQTRDMYIKSLGCLFDTQIDNIWPDFFLVPDIKKYIDNLGEENDFYSEYKDIFLEHAKNFNCQFLIQNNEPDYVIQEVEDFNNIDNKDKKEGIIYTDGTEYKIYIPGEDLVEFTDTESIKISESGGDFIHNYIEDTSNYLVYFFKPISVYENLRPAYYVFIDGLLRDVYSIDETIINYDSPTKYNPYEIITKDKNIPNPIDVKENIFLKTLEKYKSNFMIDNNHIYYYKNYFNGPKYYSTIWMRFVLGKIYRQLHKDRWYYLSEKSIGIIESRIKNTLAKIQNRFSIVKSISIIKFRPNLIMNYLELGIDTYVNDLMNNNMTLDIIINYNETNTD